MEKEYIGRIYDFRIYNYALTNDEIAKIYYYERLNYWHWYLRLWFWFKETINAFSRGI